jgi:hypothetical protein
MQNSNTIPQNHRTWFPIKKRKYAIENKILAKKKSFGYFVHDRLNVCRNIYHPCDVLRMNFNNQYTIRRIKFSISTAGIAEQ